MSRAIDLPEVIPVFVLPGALLLPRGRLPLHIFEPRYLAMLTDCMKTDHRLIGMVQPHETPGGTRLHSIGCAGRLTSFSETDDGRYMVTLTGIARFRIRDEVQGFTPYPRHVADWSDFARDMAGPETDPDFDRAAFLDLLARYFAAQGLSTDWDSLQEAEPDLLITTLSMLCPFEPADKQALLEAPSLQTRRETLNTLMEIALRGGTEGDPLQ
ncbi:LON peptidase substrate-binding domain-containing protein [Gemmobacter serpentinus]|uniref:LON peptidase substrate-binding domain-containing protein n=1 Tax=Gemmobacter serpentinus TaxID=2652247 RepID=UPI00124E6ED7|nr:LON peptidase substrate-binding domain-containing protein [Gemmobacter serpentinus]